MADKKKKAAQNLKEGSEKETEKDPKVEAKPAAETEAEKTEMETGTSGDSEHTEETGTGQTTAEAAEKNEAEENKNDGKEAGVNENDGKEAGVNENDGKEAGSPDGEEKSGDQKKSFFRKKEKKDPKDEKIAEMTDRLQRQMAEFDNFRKRTEKEKAQMYDIGAKSVIEKVLPVVDNFERGLENCDKDDPFADGMTKVYKQLTTMLTDLGVKPIEAVGKEFDPNFHNAVMHTEDESVGENIVVEEFQKGYLYKDTVVRHSMVKVAN